MRDGFGVEPGVWFRLALGGITGHRDFARDTGVIVQPEDATQGRRRHRARVHRARRPHQPQQGAAQIRARRLGLREIPRRGRGEARAHSSPRVAARGRARRVRRSIASRISACIAQKQPGLNWIGVVLPVGQLTAEQMRGLAKHRARSRRRRYPPHRLAEPADLRRAGRRGRASPRPRSRRSGSTKATVDPRRARRLHRQRRLPLRRLRHQGARRGDRAMRARRASRSIGRSTSTSPAAITPARSTTSATSACIGAQGRDRRTKATRSRAITSTSAAASAPDAALGREIYPRREGGGRAALGRAHAARPISRTAPDATRRFLAFTRRHEVDALKRMFDAEAVE